MTRKRKIEYLQDRYENIIWILFIIAAITIILLRIFVFNGN